MMSELISISDLPSFKEVGFDTPVTWDFDLPPNLDTERIVLNASGLRYIQRVAAFDSNHIVSYTGDISSFTPNIGGVQSDGTAIATKAGVFKKAPGHKMELLDPTDDAGLMRSYFGTRAVHALNKSEIASNVANGRQGKLSREQRWANELDDSLSISLRRSCKQHLLDRQDRIAKILDSGMYCGVISPLIVGNPEYIGLVVGIGAALNASISSRTNAKSYGETFIRDRRWSLAFFGGMQPDRYLAATALTHTTSLISARK